ncbi:hypothetical protein ES703_93011 [subsurface metagenome]
MNEDKYTKLKVLNYPICGTQYMPSEERTIPTCSKPDCIREYKRRGLPLTIQPAQPASIPRQSLVWLTPGQSRLQLTIAG